MDLNWLDSKIAMKDLITNSHLCEISHKLVGYLPGLLMHSKKLNFKLTSIYLFLLCFYYFVVFIKQY